MKFTLLEIVQDILNDLDGDEVDSYTDTSEATQIANIVRSSYFHLVSQRDLPEHKTFFKLEETSASTPTLMNVPSDVLKTYWINYDVKNNPGAFSGGVFSGSAFDVEEASSFGLLPYQDPEEFFYTMGRMTWDGTATDDYSFTTATGDIFAVKYRTDVNPTKYTILEDYYVLFDNINTDISVSYLESDLTWCYGLKEPVFTMSDGYTPDLDATEFNLLMEEAKSACSIKLRQVQDPKAEQRARRGWIRSQKQAHNQPHKKFFRSLPDYGRK
jgi:hypothetical protein